MYGRESARFRPTGFVADPAAEPAALMGVWSNLADAIPRPDPSGGRPGDPGWFGPGSAAWRINGETALLLAGPRALLMQVAHPAVARGVIEHSAFRRDPFRRLRRTLEPMLSITFGDHDQAAQALGAVNEVHARVHGEGPDGPPYDAFDPGLLLWVHATLVDSALVAYERFVGTIPPDAKERYYIEMKLQATALGVPAGLLPGTYAAFGAYLADATSALEIGDDGRALCDDVLWPPIPAVLAPVSALIRVVTIAMLPARLAVGFGLRQVPADRLVLAATGAALRGVLPMLPGSLRRWAHARDAASRVDHASAASS